MPTTTPQRLAGAEPAAVIDDRGSPAPSPRPDGDVDDQGPPRPCCCRSVCSSSISWQHPTSSPPQASVSALQMDQVGTTALASTVSISSQQWGTYIDLNCVCLAPVTAHHDRLAMVVVSRDGTHTQLATWVADPGHTAKLAGSTSTPVDQIVQVQVVSADNGNVLLQRSLETACSARDSNRLPSRCGTCHSGRRRRGPDPGVPCSIR